MSVNVLTQVGVYVQGERVSLDTQMITFECTATRELASVLKHSSPSPTLAIFLFKGPQQSQTQPKTGIKIELNREL